MCRQHGVLDLAGKNGIREVNGSGITLILLSSAIREHYEANKMLMRHVYVAAPDCSLFGLVINPCTAVAGLVYSLYSVGSICRSTVASPLPLPFHGQPFKRQNDVQAFLPHRQFS